MYQFSRPHELIRSCSLDANRGLTCSQFHARSPAHAVTRPTSRTSGEASPYVGCSATAATHNRRSRPSLTQTDRLHEIDRDRGSPTAPKASVRVDLFGHAQPVNCASPAAQAKRVSTRAKRECAARRATGRRPSVAMPGNRHSFSRRLEPRRVPATSLLPVCAPAVKQPRATAGTHSRVSL